MLSRILEADLDELNDLPFLVSNHPTVFDPSAADAQNDSESQNTDEAQQQLEQHYQRIILAFHRSDAEEIDRIVASAKNNIQNHPEYAYFKHCADLRRTLRTDLIRSENPFQDKMEILPQLWAGEISILHGRIHAANKDALSAQVHFEKARIYLTKAGLKKKALRASLNWLIAESHIRPEKNLISNYHALYRQAMKKHCREIAVATTCLINISREYQRRGSPLAGLKYGNSALRLSERNFGSRIHHLALCQRAHLLYELNRFDEMSVDMDCLGTSPYEEVKLALDFLKGLAENARTLGLNESSPKRKVRMTQKSRANCSDRTPPNSTDMRDSKKKDRLKLSGLESVLVKFLAQPRARSEILDHIYGTRLDLETKLNRFKSLLNTLRKKRPEIVIFDNGTYRLSDTIFSYIDSGTSDEPNSIHNSAAT